MGVLAPSILSSSESHFLAGAHYIKSGPILAHSILLIHCGKGKSQSPLNQTQFRQTSSIVKICRFTDIDK